jgi:type II secretory pathway component GspD/PulD (secretin)
MSTTRALSALAITCVFGLAGSARADWFELASVLRSLVATAPAPKRTPPTPLDSGTMAVGKVSVESVVGFTSPSDATGQGETAPMPTQQAPPVTPQVQSPAQSTATTNTQPTTKATGQPTTQPSVSPSPTPQPIQPSAPVQRQGFVSNVFAGTDIREALSEIASAAGVTIIPDESLKATAVYMEFRNEPIESAIEKLALLSGAYWKKRSDGVYLVSQGTPDSGLFREFAESTNYIPENEAATTLQSLLPANYKPYVQVDAKTNLITITAPTQLLSRIVADLQHIDAPVRQFVVEALVTELNGEATKDFGFSWSWRNFAQGDDLGLTYAKAGFADIAKLKALIENHKATLRANPRLSAFEGREASLTIGQETYFSILSGNVQFPTAQIQLIKTGVTLQFTGYISRDGTITLTLSPEVSDAIVSVNGNPTTNVRRVSTQVRVRPGETIAIGGLIQESNTHTVAKIPILGNIPLLGELFTHRATDNRRSEVIILITPRLSESGVGDKGIDSARKLRNP